MELKTQQLVYVAFLHEGQLKSVEMIVVGFNREAETTIVSDREGNSYNVQENDNGDLFIDSQEFGFENTVCEEAFQGILVQQEYFLDQREEDEDEECDCFEGMDAEEFMNSIMFNMLFAPENFGSETREP